MFAKKKYLVYLFIGPTIFILILVMLYPLLYGFLMSFFRNRIITSQFVGLKNYIDLFSNYRFWDSVNISLKYTTASVLLHFFLGMLLALTLNRSTIFISIARIIVLIPWMIAEPIVSIIWSWILDASYGFLNYILLKLGLIEMAISWIGDPSYALPASILVNVWRGFPFIGLLLLAGLQSIPETQYEAAIVDGANSWKLFCHITIPNLKHVMIVALTLDFIWTMRSMSLVYVLTRGGPADFTKIVPIKIYQEGFEYINIGTAASMSVVLFLILLIFTVIFIKVMKTENQ